MVVTGCVRIEIPVHLLVDMSFFGCELQYPPLLFRIGLQGCLKTKKINVLVARTSFYVRASGYTFENGTKVSVAYFML